MSNSRRQEEPESENLIENEDMERTLMKDISRESKNMEISNKSQEQSLTADVIVINDEK